MSVDRDFAGVIAACAGAHRPHGWITPSIVEAYTRLHELGWAHSVEAWTEQGELAGGLYGLRLGGLFAGESMVHLRRDGSKVALVALIELLRESGASLLDVQWVTPHLASLGAISISREEYLAAMAIVAEGQNLIVHSKERKMTLKYAELKDYRGERAQRGAVLPRGWRTVERLEVVSG